MKYNSRKIKEKITFNKENSQRYKVRYKVLLIITFNKITYYSTVSERSENEVYKIECPYFNKTYADKQKRN